MMNELLNRVTATTGLSADQAQSAVDAVLGFLKEKLPAPLASSLDSIVNTGSAGADGLGNHASGMLGNLFGKG